MPSLEAPSFDPTRAARPRSPGAPAGTSSVSPLKRLKVCIVNSDSLTSDCPSANASRLDFIKDTDSSRPQNSSLLGRRAMSPDVEDGPTGETHHNFERTRRAEDRPLQPCF